MYEACACHRDTKINIKWFFSLEGPRDQWVILASRLKIIVVIMRNERCQSRRMFKVPCEISGYAG